MQSQSSKENMAQQDIIIEFLDKYNYSGTNDFIQTAMTFNSLDANKTKFSGNVSQSLAKAKENLGAALDAAKKFLNTEEKNEKVLSGINTVFTDLYKRIGYTENSMQLKNSPKQA